MNREYRRISELLALGGVQTRLRTYPRPIQMLVGSQVSELHYLPEIDPMTRQATGRVKTARRVPG